MGLHESQSRFYENLIGRSSAFIHAIFPKVKEFFPEQLEGVDEEMFYRAINKAEPSLIRTEADELTYALHVMVRYEIEKKIIDMSLLDEDDQNTLMEYNIKVGGKMKKYTPRIAYIGTLLHDRKYSGSYNGFMTFLASCDASDFLNPEISAKIWEKINIDQSVPKSAKNA